VMAEHGSLVRDFIQRYLIDEGKDAGHEFRVARKEEYRDLLYAKLREETSELIDTVTHKECIEEIGDVLDVIDALIDAERIDRHILKIAREIKKRTRGEFKGRVVWVAGPGKELDYKELDYSQDTGGTSSGGNGGSGNSSGGGGGGTGGTSSGGNGSNTSSPVTPAHLKGTRPWKRAQR